MAGGIPSAAVAEVGASPPLYDLHLHAGDMAYDMSMDHGRPRTPPIPAPHGLQQYEPP